MFIYEHRCRYSLCVTLASAHYSRSRTWFDDDVRLVIQDAPIVQMVTVSAQIDEVTWLKIPHRSQPDFVCLMPRHPVMCNMVSSSVCNVIVLARMQMIVKKIKRLLVISPDLVLI